MRCVLSTWKLLLSHVFLHLIPAMIFLTGTAWLTQASRVWLQALLGLAQTQEGWKWWRLRKGINTAALKKKQNERESLMRPHETIKASGKGYSSLQRQYQGLDPLFHHCRIHPVQASCGTRQWFAQSWHWTGLRLCCLGESSHRQVTRWLTSPLAARAEGCLNICREVCFHGYFCL